MTQGITKLHCLVCDEPLPRHGRRKNVTSLCKNHNGSVRALVVNHGLEFDDAVQQVKKRFEETKQVVS